MNALGSLFIGAVVRLSLEGGFIGGGQALPGGGPPWGFTTFSTFSYETLALVQDGEVLLALAYLGSLLLGCVLVYLGYRLRGMLVA